MNSEDCGVVVSCPRKQEYHGEKIVFPENTAGFTVVQGESANGTGHVEDIKEITATDGFVLQLTIDTGETLTCEKLVSSHGFKRVDAHLVGGNRRSKMTLGNQIKHAIAIRE